MTREAKKLVIYVAGTISISCVAWRFVGLKEAIFTVAMCCFLIVTFGIFDLISESEKNGKA